MWHGLLKSLRRHGRWSSISSRSAFWRPTSRLSQASAPSSQRRGAAPPMGSAAGMARGGLRCTCNARGREARRPRLGGECEGRSVACPRRRSPGRRRGASCARGPGRLARSDRPRLSRCLPRRRYRTPKPRAGGDEEASPSGTQDSEPNAGGPHCCKHPGSARCRPCRVWFQQSERGKPACDGSDLQRDSRPRRIIRKSLGRGASRGCGPAGSRCVATFG